MTQDNATTVEVLVVEQEFRLTLDELCRACSAGTPQLLELVDEGVLHPTGSGPRDWQFSASALRRARTALRLSRDLQLQAAGIAMVLELLDEIELLKARLHRAGLR